MALQDLEMWHNDETEDNMSVVSALSESDIDEIQEILDDSDEAEDDLFECDAQIPRPRKK